VQDRTESYERLEFLGDSVLSLSVSSYLYDRFPFEEEGRLTKVRAFAVSRRSCNAVARRIGIDRLFLRAAPGPVGDREELAKDTTVLGDVLEALIGAVYLAFGFAAAREAVALAFLPQVEFGLRHDVDFKTVLQEHLATQGLRADYRLVAEEGPPHKRVFRSEVLVGGTVRGCGAGRSIKASEQRAAKRALRGAGIGFGASEPSETEV
jgi:ribonuclease-3